LVYKFYLELKSNSAFYRIKIFRGDPSNIRVDTLYFTLLENVKFHDLQIAGCRLMFRQKAAKFVYRNSRQNVAEQFHSKTTSSNCLQPDDRRLDVYFNIISKDAAASGIILKSKYCIVSLHLNSAS